VKHPSQKSVTFKNCHRHSVFFPLCSKNLITSFFQKIIWHHLHQELSKVVSKMLYMNQVYTVSSVVDIEESSHGLNLMSSTDTPAPISTPLWLAVDQAQWCHLVCRDKMFIPSWQHHVTFARHTVSQIEPLIITQKTVETQGMSWVLDNTKPKKIAKKCWLLQVCNYCDFQWLDKKVPKLDCDQEKWGKQKSTIIIMSHVLDKSVCVHKSISCCCFPEEEERIKILLWFHFFKWK